MKALSLIVFGFIASLSSCCLYDDGPRGKITYVDREVRPDIWKLLGDMKVKGPNPVLAKGNNFELRRSELVAWMFHNHGQQELREFARMRTLHYYFKKSNIAISADEVNERAKQLIQDSQMNLAEYLKKRLITQVHLANEIELLLFAEKFLKEEMVRIGAVKVKIKEFDTKEEAESFGRGGGGQAIWLCPFMVVDMPKLKEILFEPKVPKVFEAGKDSFFGIEVAERLEPITQKSPLFFKNLKKLEDFRPIKPTIKLFFDYLMEKQSLEFLPEKIYDKYENTKGN
jgi:hypothetical protein